MQKCLHSNLYFKNTHLYKNLSKSPGFFLTNNGTLFLLYIIRFLSIRQFYTRDPWEGLLYPGLVQLFPKGLSFLWQYNDGWPLLPWPTNNCCLIIPIYYPKELKRSSLYQLIYFPEGYWKTSLESSMKICPLYSRMCRSCNQIVP